MSSEYRLKPGSAKADRNIARVTMGMAPSVVLEHGSDCAELLKDVPLPPHVRLEGFFDYYSLRHADLKPSLHLALSIRMLDEVVDYAWHRGRANPGQQCKARGDVHEQIQSSCRDYGTAAPLVCRAVAQAYRHDSGDPEVRKFWRGVGRVYAKVLAVALRELALIQKLETIELAGPAVMGCIGFAETMFSTDLPLLGLLEGLDTEQPLGHLRVVGFSQQGAWKQVGDAHQAAKAF